MCTSHKNLINLKEVFLTGKSIFFIYKMGGIPLVKIQEQISRFLPRIEFSELEVATICRESEFLITQENTTTVRA